MQYTGALWTPSQCIFGGLEPLPGEQGAPGDRGANGEPGGPGEVGRGQEVELEDIARAVLLEGENGSVMFARTMFGGKSVGW